MTTIDPHALNKLLAKWAGVEVVEVASSLDPDSPPQWIYDTGKRVLKHEKLSRWATWDEWDPFTDANQVELAKAGLRKKGYGYEVMWVHSRRNHRVTIWKIEDHDAERRKNGYGEEMIWFPTCCWVKWHESESLAMGLAIQAMEEGA